MAAPARWTRSITSRNCYKRDGQKFDPGEGVHVEAVTSVPGNVMKPPFPFKQHGQCGRWVSSVFPNIAGHVDEIAFLMSVKSKTNVHGPASYLMNTGFVLPGFPCMGAWLSYGLGRLTDNLPTFVVLPDPRGLPYNAQGNFSSGFLPGATSGDDHPSDQSRADRRPRAAEHGEVHHTGKRSRRAQTCSPK